MDKYTSISDKGVREKVYWKYDGCCAYCGTPVEIDNFQIDHIEPLRRHLDDISRKGKNVIENYNPACRSCNATKGSLGLEQFRQELYLKLDRLSRDEPRYRILRRIGVIEEYRDKILFHFEKIESNE